MTTKAEDLELPSLCSDCNSEIWPDTARAFASGPDTYLCFECAERRGGVYDAALDRWVVAPEVTGVPDERRPHP